MSSISELNASGTSSSSQTLKSSSSNQMSMDDAFMQLLLAELRYQDPMEPMKSDQMLSQMAQLNSLQELQRISLAIKGLEQSNLFLTAASMIGKSVAYIDNNEGLASGVVTAFSVVGDQFTLVVDGTEVPMGSVIGVKEAMNSND